MCIMLSAVESILTDTFVKWGMNGWMDGWGVVSYHALQFCTSLSSFVNKEAETEISYIPANFSLFLKLINQLALSQQIQMISLLAIKLQSEAGFKELCWRNFYKGCAFIHSKFHPWSQLENQKVIYDVTSGSG